MLQTHPGTAFDVDPKKHSAIACENGRHSAVARVHDAVSGVSYAECRHCGCKLMRTAAARRWYRTGVMG
ncbi:hypothetical protein [Sphingomonas montanisoli]|uniref:Uncharacterized protein n=1 Tax=Sphingomonas montanisoli TaxID=2606412 RepID=A0A5D9C8D4_9SPHN|nr:hypothetical protein [Sphingomonas montanisoli]TZG27537.1 hypothetical protein FYJ91_08095 [Sphingomonas montanisoli]